MSARHFLVVDDHTLIVQGLSFLLKTRFPDSVVHTGTTADQARSLVALYGSATDLLILDLSLPDVEKPTDLLEELVRQNPTLKILVLSGITDPEQVSQVLRLGAAGFVPKSLETETLTNAVDLVLKGGVYVPMKLLSEAQKKRFIDNATLKGNAPDVRLTDRQKDVLLCLARGLPIKSICRELNLSEGTVKTHVTAIYRAFHANNRTQALIAAQKAGYEILL